MGEMTGCRTATIFCLPFAGGGSHSYAEFQRCAGAGLRIVGLDLPGRGRRFSEPLLTNLQALADDVFEQIRDRLDGPYAVYGHSMGACIGHLLVKQIIREHYPPPFHLFVSGREAPSVVNREKDLFRLPRADFIEAMRRFEGATNEVLENRELMDLFEPILRADFQALDTRAYEKSTPFAVPITVMRGRDEHVTRGDAQRWQEETTEEISLLEFPGGHFFIFKNAQEIVEILSRKTFSR
jgi:surfactin synthase thioesterase subunit